MHFHFHHALAVPPKIVPFTFPEGTREGEKIFATCVVSQGDGPMRLQWLKESQVLGDSVDNIKSMTAGTSTHRIGESDALVLQISRVKSQDAANYTCLAKNNAGEVKHTAKLVVHGKHLISNLVLLHTHETSSSTGNEETLCETQKHWVLFLLTIRFTLLDCNCSTNNVQFAVNYIDIDINMKLPLRCFLSQKRESPIGSEKKKTQSCLLTKCPMPFICMLLVVLLLLLLCESLFFCVSHTPIYSVILLTPQRKLQLRWQRILETTGRTTFSHFVPFQIEFVSQRCKTCCISSYRHLIAFKFKFTAFDCG